MKRLACLCGLLLLLAGVAHAQVVVYKGKLKERSVSSSIGDRFKGPSLSPEHYIYTQDAWLVMDLDSIGASMSYDRCEYSTSWYIITYDRHSQVYSVSGGSSDPFYNGELSYLNDGKKEYMLFMPDIYHAVLGKLLLLNFHYSEGMVFGQLKTFPTSLFYTGLIAADDDDDDDEVYLPKTMKGFLQSEVQANIDVDEADVNSSSYYGYGAAYGYLNFRFDKRTTLLMNQNPEVDGDVDDAAEYLAEMLEDRGYTAFNE